MTLKKKTGAVDTKKKFLILIIFFFYGFFEFALSESLLIQSNNIKKIIYCANNTFLKECQNIIFYTEMMQLREFNKGNFRCQTSLLGAQSEFIRKIYFKKSKNVSSTISIPFVIKNCNF